MYQNYCKKCGSSSLHTETKGSSTGLYCNDCGAWIKWLGKDELRAFTYSNKNNRGIEERLETFVKYLDGAIGEEMTRIPASTEDAIRKSSYCLALEKNKNALINILHGREFNDTGE